MLTSGNNRTTKRPMTGTVKWYYLHYRCSYVTNTVGRSSPVHVVLVPGSPRTQYRAWATSSARSVGSDSAHLIGRAQRWHDPARGQSVSRGSRPRVDKIRSLSRSRKPSPKSTPSPSVPPRRRYDYRLRHSLFPLFGSLRSPSLRACNTLLILQWPA
jgi:hypothetical protein